MRGRPKSLVGRRGTERHLRARIASPAEALERRMLLSVVPVGMEFRLNTFTTGAQGWPSVAMDHDGDFVVAWMSFGQDGDGYGIFARRYNAAGAPLGTEFQVNTYTTSFQLHPAVAMDADGDFVVAWSSYAQGGAYPWSTDVYAQRYDAAGAPQGDEFRVNTYTTFGQFFPVVAMNAAGDFIVVWHSQGQDGSSSGVFAQRYNSSGAPQGIEFQVNTFTPGAQGGNNNPSAVSMDADGNFVVAWASYGQGDPSGEIYAQRFDSTGAAQGPELHINQYTTGNQHDPSVALDADGDFMVTWASVGQDGSGYGGVYARRYNAAGKPAGDEFRANVYTTDAQRSPSAAVDAAGNVIIAWNSFNQDGSNYGVYARRYNAAGEPQTGEFRVNTYTTNFQAIPDVAVRADGNFVIVWESVGQDGSQVGVYGQRYAVAPEVLASAFFFETAPHRLQFAFTQDVSTSLGTDDIVLENLTTMQTIPSGDFSLAYEPLTNTATFAYAGPGGLITSVLPDGSYRATVLAAGVTNGQGIPLEVDQVFNFFFLSGDANHDGRVNLQDFNILAANFGQTNRTFAQGDFNYDGAVNLSDFNLLAGRFGAVLGPPDGDDALDQLLA